MESIIFVMSLMGSVMLVLYLVLQPIASRYFSAKWKYAILKICMVLLVIPLPELKNYFLIMIDSVNKVNPFLNYAPTKVHMGQAIEIQTGKILALPMKMHILVIFTLIWLIGFSIILSWQIYSYFLIKKFMMKDSKPISDAYILEMLENIRLELDIKRKVVPLISPNINSPVTMGFFSSQIILPDLTLENEKLRYILEHELVHIKHKDFFIRLFAVFIVALHWFNPLSYLLLKEVGIISEYACDESVVLNLNEKQRKIYGHTILDMSTKNILYSGPGKILISSFGNDNVKAMKERLGYMKSIKRTKAGVRVLSIVMGIAMTMMSMMTVFAYNEADLIEGDNAKVESSEMVTATFDKKGADSQSLKLKADSHSVKVIEYFVNSEGEVRVVNGNTIDEKALCIHRYEDGEYVRHTLNSNGSCKEEYYNAERCVYCGKIVVGTKVKTITYVSCSH